MVILLDDLVSLIKVKNMNKDIKQSISKALDLINFRLDQNISSIIIKPNLCYYWKASTGYTTDPRVVGGIVDYLREVYGDVTIKIAESDASAMRIKYAFKALDYEKLSANKNVDLFNLSEDKLEKKEVLINGHNLTLDIPMSLLDCDLLINVPTLKSIDITKITCAMKNMFGCLGKRRKISYHKNINEVLVGINKIIPPHLTIVDSLVALGRYPVKVDLIMAGKNDFSVDWIAAKILGFNPKNIQFLRIAIRENLGVPTQIRTVGESFNEFKKVVPSTRGVTFKPSNKLLLKLLKVYTTVIGDVIPPFLEID